MYTYVYTMRNNKFFFFFHFKFEMCSKHWWLHVRVRVVTGPPWPGKTKSLLYIKFKNFMIFFTLKKMCDHPKFFFRSNIIQL